MTEELLIDPQFWLREIALTEMIENHYRSERESDDERIKRIEMSVNSIEARLNYLIQIVEVAFGARPGNGEATQGSS